MNLSFLESISLLREQEGIIYRECCFINSYNEKWCLWYNAISDTLHSKFVENKLNILGAHDRCASKYIYQLTVSDYLAKDWVWSKG